MPRQKQCRTRSSVIHSASRPGRGTGKILPERVPSNGLATPLGDRGYRMGASPRSFPKLTRALPFSKISTSLPRSIVPLAEVGGDHDSAG